MPKSGEEIGADLADLKKVGVISLPRIAEVYVEANKKIGGTSSSDDGLISATGPHGEAGETSVYPVWMGVRDAFQSILGNTANNVESAGNVVVHIVNSYASNDTAAGNEMDSCWKNRTVDDTDPRDKPLDKELDDPTFPK